MKVYPNSTDAIDVVSDFNEDIGLGLLSPGIYSYSINLYSVVDIPTVLRIESPLLAQPVTGSFTVVPEPASFMLAALGIVGIVRPVQRRSA